ncbi:alpha/beta hydrolase [Microbacterium sp. Mu-80]|uniref:Alpha/beta hydrolase n=1 Tax=Microbacterium bandirmense TaxID=3122050 RepID=A0ABU8LEA7_9MICO
MIAEARHVAHSLPDQCQGLATLAGAFQLDHAQRRLPRHEVIVHDAGVLERAGDARAEFEEMAVVHTDQALRDFERFVLPGLRGADARVIDRLSATYVEGYSPESDAREPFLAPALHVFGRQDHVVGYEDGLALADHYPRGSFVVLDGTGHNPHLERPQLVGALIRDWLGRVDRHRPCD